ncbi:hypothetical protein DSO57_1011183 [Entomophthora muscae]|uniref:Uncharacterized protein n=1 Tax=Entomophthora muscae TaxID=34485 RepID=A0ACC2UFR8_9FUNG|nr:hypothetical protein DSO57_1011183 [Entomophthora muscae]
MKKQKLKIKELDPKRSAGEQEFKFKEQEFKTKVQESKTKYKEYKIFWRTPQNGNPFQLVPGYGPGHILETVGQEPHSLKKVQLVRIDNSSSLETWAREQESNTQPWIPSGRQACGPRDRPSAFPGIEPPQDDTKNVDPCSEKSQTKEIIAPNGRLITVPNGGTDLATISFINLKSTPATNQEPSPGKRHGPRAQSHDLNTKAR